MTKMRFSFDVDLSEVFPDLTDAEADIAVQRVLLGGANARHKGLLRKVRTDESLSKEDKSEAMATHVRGMMLARMAHCNWKAEPLSDSAPINMEIDYSRPF